MEISLTTEIVKWVEEVDYVTIGKLMGKGFIMYTSLSQGAP